jgi:hypothetical protein
VDLPVGESDEEVEGLRFDVNITFSHQQSSETIESGNFPRQYRTRSNLMIIRSSLRITELFKAGLVIPFASIQNRARDLPHHDLFGQGDVSAFVDYTPFSEDFLDGLSFRGGLKLPTGRSEKDLDLNNGPATLLQLGSGTLDWMLGAQFRLSPIEDLNTYARLGLQIPLHRNNYGFRPSDMLSFAIGADFSFDDMWTASLSFSSLVLNEASVDGDNFNKSGGSFLFMTPSIAADIGYGLSAYASLRLSMIRNSHNPANGPLISLGLNWTLGF